MWAAQTCNDPVGQTQPTMERHMRAQEDDHGP